MSNKSSWNLSFRLQAALYLRSMQNFELRKRWPKLILFLKSFVYTYKNFQPITLCNLSPLINHLIQHTELQHTADLVTPLEQVREISEY